MKRVVVFGAGMVAGAHVRYLLDHGLQVTVASRTLAKAQELVAGQPNGRAVAVNSDDTAALEDQVRQHDLAVSLLPYAYHPVVAQLCIRHGVHMVTTSYIKQAMADLDGAARAAGVLLLNEIGVDPGIDHMTAMRIIHQTQAAGGRITKFISFCGGLPAPEANTNPFGYKFSWSPRGVLLAGKNAAQYRWDGELVEIPAGTLFDHHWPVTVTVAGQPTVFEGYPNRDSLSYLPVYGIEGVATMFRGTLRNPGWCATLRKIADLGLLDEAERGDWADGWAGLIRHVVGGHGALRDDLAAFLHVDPGSKVITDLEWLGLLTEQPLLAGVSAPIDLLTATMLAKMQYAPGERDMLILQHQFEAEYPAAARGGARRERMTSTMVDFGLPHGDTSMARTVGLPAAIAVRLIAEGRIGLTGVHAPVMPEIYEPVLAELEALGIHFEETRAVVDA